MSDATVQMMSSQMMAGQIMRGICILTGLAVVYMGYRLFFGGICKPTDMTAAKGPWKLILRRAAPGTLFALFGAVLIVASMFSTFARLEAKAVTETDIEPPSTTVPIRVNGASAVADKPGQAPAAPTKPADAPVKKKETVSIRGIIQEAIPKK